MKICSGLAHLFNNLNNFFNQQKQNSFRLSLTQAAGEWHKLLVIDKWIQHYSNYSMNLEFCKLHFSDNTVYSW